MIKKNPLIYSQTFTINEDINLNAQLFVLIKDSRVIRQFTDRIRKPPQVITLHPPPPPGFIERLAKVSKNTTSTNPLQFRKFENEKKNITIWKQRGVYFWAIAEYFPSKNQIQGLLTRLRKLAPPYTCVYLCVRAGFSDSWGFMRIWGLNPQTAQAKSNREGPRKSTMWPETPL